MSYYVRFECDGLGCDKTAWTYRATAASVVRLTERELLRLGWVKDGAYHFCPRHKELAVVSKRRRRGRRWRGWRRGVWWAGIAVAWAGVLFVLAVMAVIAAASL